MKNENEVKSGFSEFNQYLIKAISLNEEKQIIETPYISVNKLAEYSITTSATRRNNIIKSLKEDSDFKKRYYTMVKNALPGYFNSKYDENIIDKAIANAQNKTMNSTWDKSDRDNSVLALESLKETVMPDISDYDVINPDYNIDHIMLSSVKVILKPEIYLQNKTNEKLGAVKFHLAKTSTNRLNTLAMQSVATCVRSGFAEYGFDLKQIEPNACISIDIFEKNYATSPSAYKRTLENLNNACKEIFDRWDKV